MFLYNRTNYGGAACGGNCYSALDSCECLEHPKKQELLVAMSGNYVPIGRRKGSRYL
ncbi:hypothetical protein [Scytonema sp. PCC 10023]|uniref:hypothetical protein n=1 Tax=Scytonema sp. PCC 10023 TaxID=1680591 RepID=UPI0039C68CD4